MFKTAIEFAVMMHTSKPEVHYAVVQRGANLAVVELTSKTKGVVWSTLSQKERNFCMSGSTCIGKGNSFLKRLL